MGANSVHQILYSWRIVNRIQNIVNEYINEQHIENINGKEYLLNIPVVDENNNFTENISKNDHRYTVI